VLRTRILTAAVLLPAVLAAVVFAPNWFFTLFIAVLGVFGLYEIAAMTGTLKLVALPLYAVVGGVDQVVPVDLHIRGCPPRPVQLLSGLLALLERVA